jgi:D-glycero-D-manno-heptose 1,7-bisphosphate phosphatase
MKLAILDRDGVINYDSDEYIKSVDEFRLIPGSLAAIARLNKAGYTVVITTNQSGIARGFYDEETLNAMHNKLRALLKEHAGHIDAIYYCPHGPDDHCDCRKPKPGMLKQALQDFNASAQQAFAIGDSVRDLESAQSVGVKPILVRTGKGEKSLQQMAAKNIFQDAPVYDDLAAAVADILN